MMKFVRRKKYRILLVSNGYYTPGRLQRSPMVRNSHHYTFVE
jgi:hypothetical protein